MENEKIARELLGLAKELIGKDKVTYSLSPINPAYIVIQGVDSKNTDEVNNALMALYSHLAKNKRHLDQYFDLKGIMTQRPQKTVSTIVVKSGFRGGEFEPAEKAMKQVLKKLK